MLIVWVVSLVRISAQEIQVRKKQKKPFILGRWAILNLFLDPFEKLMKAPASRCRKTHQSTNTIL